MKSLKKVLACVVIAASATSANAALYKFEAAYGVAAAQAAEAAFISSTYNGVLETFDDPIANYTITNETYQDPGATGSQATWVVGGTAFGTKVGTFTMSQPNTASNGNVRDDLLMIEDNTTGEFGRDMNYGSQWLDSNDAQEVIWSILDGNFNAFGFYLSDPNDQGAKLRLTYEDGSSDFIDITSPSPNGTIAYITVFSDVFFSNASLTFDNNTTRADGWGIDNVRIARVPEPATLALLGLGLVGVGMARRRKQS